jgi:hypothetical protein
VTPEQLAKMQAGRAAAAALKSTQAALSGAQEHADWTERHVRARQDLLAERARRGGWGVVGSTDSGDEKHE